jgi:alkylation response protein AidB-like acyl-CoA dehydrogenase
MTAAAATSPPPHGPIADRGAALGTDYFLIRSELSDLERDYLDRTRRFVEDEVLPVINDYWERAELPLDLIRRLGQLGLVGDGIDYPGVPAMSPIAAGLINMELNRGDGSVGTAALRAVWQAAIELREVRVPVDNALPGARSFKDTARVLKATRQTCAWAALGHAVAAYDVALAYGRSRRQFGKPLISFQMVQERLVQMLAEVTAMQLYCLRIGRLMESDQLSDTIAALAKLNNTVKARQVIAEARNLLGGNGLLLEHHVIRHMSDIEAIYTYEGTEAIQMLLVGRDITGVAAFA